jgi:protein O-mannosyl-transferase
LWRLFTEPYNSYEFLPLRDLSYWFDIRLFGLTPSAFRVHNILLYLLCLPLVYWITRDLWRYFRPADAASASWAAAAVTALFVVHPSHVEAVVWISGRKDVLAAMFSLLALWLAVNAKLEQGLSHRYATATLLVMLAAMLSKATAVMVAPVIAILWVIFWLDIPALDRRRSPLLWPLASLLLAACIALIFSANSMVKATVYVGVEVITRALAVLGWLARLAVSPESRHFFYPVFDDPYLPVMVTLGVVILLAVVASVVVILRKRSLEGFALIAFVLLCMPYTQLIPYVTPTLVSDRFLTLAVWPAVLLIVALSWRLKTWPRTALLLVIGLLWGFQTVERPRDWRSYEALVDTDLRAYPGNYLPAFEKIMRYQLPKGRFREAGETANNITISEARDIMTKLVEVANDLRDASITGDPRDAMTHLQNLEPLLKQPPVQAKWDPGMFHFWKESQDSFVLEWQWLVKGFPNDASVRYNARLALVSILKYGNAATQSQSLP